LEIETVMKCNLCGSSDLIDIDRKNGIGQCRACGFIFNRERPTSREIETYYSREGKYNDWLSLEKERDILWQRRLRVVLKYRQNGALLDVGTGTGQFLHFAKKQFDVSGTEVSASGIELAKNKYGIDIMKGTLENLSFGNKFDVISLYHVLEHVPDPPRPSGGAGTCLTRADSSSLRSRTMFP
jgi:SAM-dependent methyltransferase